MSLYKENDYYIVTAVNKTIYILHEGTLKAKYAKDEYHKLTNDGYATILGKTRRIWIFPVAHANYHIRNVYNALITLDITHLRHVIRHLITYLIRCLIRCLRCVIRGVIFPKY